MPTIPQLPAASAAGEGDELPISQAGITRSVSVSELLASTQPLITLPSANLLGRVSLGPGGPEPVQVGVGLALAGPAIAATALDHLNLPVNSGLLSTDDLIINSGGLPAQVAATSVRGLFQSGNNVSINSQGSISATTDPSVTAELTTLTQGLGTTNSNLAALAARVPSGGYVALNSQGQITAPMAGAVDLGTVTVSSGAPSRTLDSKALDVHNVVDFGAVSGNTDSTAAFNAAFAALNGSGGEIFVPAGDYQLTSSLNWAGKAFTLRGAGKGLTRLHFNHTGVGISVSQTNPYNKVNLIGFSGYAESTTGPTAAVAQLSYPSLQSFGYASAFISDVECFGYPNSANGTSPYPQTFNRGFILDNCWSVQINNVSWFGAPAAAGATSSAVIELNGCIDTRISGVQAYYGNAIVLQTGYCEGIYIQNPLVVGADFLFKQTDITQWPTYSPTKNVLLGLWAANGEINTNLGTVQASNMNGGYFVGLDISRDGGPNTPQNLFLFANVSNFFVVGCNFVGGPSGGNSQDTAFNFSSTYNSSGNVLGACFFQDMATAIRINGVNGTVGLTTFGLNIGNVPLSTAIIDNSAINSGNLLQFATPATTSVPAGLASTKDHVFAASDGSVAFQATSLTAAANHVRVQPAATSNPPYIIFEGNDSTVNGVLQTKGGNLYVSASGGTSNSGNLLSLLNIAGSSSCVQIQNATSGNLCIINTSSGGLSIQPKGALWFSPSGGIFCPNLPTTKPATGSYQIWNNGGVLSVA